MLHLLPQLWFRNTWSWKPSSAARPEIDRSGEKTLPRAACRTGRLLSCTSSRHGELLFCDNETNGQRLFGADGVDGYFKDAFHEYVVRGDRAAVNPARRGTKAAATTFWTCPPAADRSAATAAD